MPVNEVRIADQVVTTTAGRLASAVTGKKAAEVLLLDVDTLILLLM
jgi:hypothetical protein